MTLPDHNTTQPAAQKEQSNRLNSRLNWLRAGVLGANDGIVSVSALILGVIATGVSHGAILASGVAATIAGAISMALGEFVSVSAQRDSEHMVMERERLELLHTPDEERQEIAKSFRVMECQRKPLYRRLPKSGAMIPSLRTCASNTALTPKT